MSKKQVADVSIVGQHLTHFPSIGTKSKPITAGNSYVKWRVMHEEIDITILRLSQGIPQPSQTLFAVTSPTLSLLNRVKHQEPAGTAINLTLDKAMRVNQGVGEHSQQLMTTIMVTD
tara:strand:+ start:91 stop:441 length:351 start_codon:yes stop_codon:yes gene_type:complete